MCVVEFERAESVGVALQNVNRKLSVCHALTPPHMTSWTHTHPVSTETSPDTAEECDVSDSCQSNSNVSLFNVSASLVSCDPQERQLERQMKKLDARVGKVFRALEENCLSVVILPGHGRYDTLTHSLSHSHTQFVYQCDWHTVCLQRRRRSSRPLLHSHQTELTNACSDSAQLICDWLTCLLWLRPADLWLADLINTWSVFIAHAFSIHLTGFLMYLNTTELLFYWKHLSFFDAMWKNTQLYISWSVLVVDPND